MSNALHHDLPPGISTGHSERRLASWLSATCADQAPIPCGVSDWFDLAESATRNGIAGLLLERAETLGLTIPEPVHYVLQRQASQVAANNTRLQHALERLVTPLYQAGIPVVLLKGAALNLTAYARPDLRPMSDLDLLVRVNHAEKAVEVLQDAGCRLGMDLIREGFFPRYYYETELIGDGPNPARVDLHARPLRPLPCAKWMPDDVLHQHTQPVRLGEAEVLIPSAEAMFIHLAAHAAFHGCPRLIWLYDLKRWIDYVGNEMDWPRVVELAREWRLVWPVTKAIERATGLVGTICPEEVLAELQSCRTSWRDRLVLAQSPRDASSPVAHVLTNLICTPGIRFRLGYLAALLRPSRSHLAEIYPRRHMGWVACAHAWRTLRIVGRLLRVSRPQVASVGG